MVIFCIVIIAGFAIYKFICEMKYQELEGEVLEKLDLLSWDSVPHIDAHVTVKSRKALETYDAIKFFKENKERLVRAKWVLGQKANIANKLQGFLKYNEFLGRSQYDRVEERINVTIMNARAYRVHVEYISSAGNNLGQKNIEVSRQRLEMFENDPSLLMGKGEYTQYLKDKQKEALEQKQHEYYEKVSKIVDFANENRDSLPIKGSREQLDNLTLQLIDKEVSNIKKIKTADDEGWKLIASLIMQHENDIRKIVEKNHKIIRYYDSEDFLKIKEICNAMMSTQKEFNDYIIEKVAAIAGLFGTKGIRSETINEDEYQYIRPYKKTITPFTAEVSATVFASAENNPLEYVVKNFYSEKSRYPEQIQKLHLLVEELATLKEAKQIIENYKAEYQQYLVEVPDYVMAEDEAGFYSRLGFAHIDESVLTVEYEFAYTSNGGRAKRTFVVPMTEETIVNLIKMLEGKLTLKAFTKEQRTLMTNKLREFIKRRDNFTCCNCGNSVFAEPNLLLEIDHIVPVSKGGYTTEENLQTLCWKCNRTKSNKLDN